MNTLKLDIMTILLVVFALLITGCAAPGSLSNAGNGAFYGWPPWTGESQEIDSRFTVNYDPDVMPGPWAYIVHQVWADVQACTGIYPPDPELIIEYMPPTEMPVINKLYYAGAYINYNARYIRVMDIDPLENQSNYLRHELVHYILWWDGAPQSDLDNHNSPFYMGCQV